MITVVGGMYREVCIEPARDEVYGSGGRAAAALVDLTQDVTLHTFYPEEAWNFVKVIANSLGFQLKVHNAATAVRFDYEHGLARPVISPPLHHMRTGASMSVTAPAPPRLLPMWDSTLLAYQDRGRVIPPDYRRLVIRQNGDVLPSLLVDGYVAGVWRPVDGGIEATAFHPLPEEAWAGLASEARALLAFLDERDPAVYRRYTHWWSKLSGADVRLLPS